MIFSSSIIEFSVIHTYPPSRNSSCWDELVISFLTTVISPFFGTTWTGLTHELSELILHPKNSFPCCSLIKVLLMT